MHSLLRDNGTNKFVTKKRERKKENHKRTNRIFQRKDLRKKLRYQESFLVSPDCIPDMGRFFLSETSGQMGIEFTRVSE